MDGNISFQTLGPSPFHADCTVTAGDFSSQEKHKLHFEANTNQRRGYDEVVLSYNKLRFKNAQEAAEYIFEEISDELGFFYQLVGIRVAISREWESVEELIGKHAQNISPR